MICIKKTEKKDTDITRSELRTKAPQRQVCKAKKKKYEKDIQKILHLVFFLSILFFKPMEDENLW